MDVRLAKQDAQDLEGLLTLYTQLHDNAIPAHDANLEALWADILARRGHYVVVGIEDGRIISSCVLVVVPNLTHGQRPYALVENVITHAEYRRRGHGTKILHFAQSIAKQNDCYKIMLLTGSKEEGTLHFYERTGYNKNDKTAFVQWLE